MRIPKSVTEHRSFRLTKPAKLKFVKTGLGKQYVPGAFQKTLRDKPPSQATTKEEAYFLRQMKSDRTLANSEEMKRFAKGFLQEAHEEEVKLRPGFNPSGKETEQAGRLLKEYRTESTKSSPMEERAEHHREMGKIRERLGIQHGASFGVAPNIAEPTALGQGWTSEHRDWQAEQTKPGVAAKEPSARPAAPTLSAAAGGFGGPTLSAVPTAHQASGSVGSSLASIHVTRHPADILFIGRGLHEIDSSRLHQETGYRIAVRPSSADVPGLQQEMPYSLVIVEDDAGPDAPPVEPADVPRATTGLIVFMPRASLQRHQQWMSVGATEILPSPASVDGVRQAIQRYLHPGGKYPGPLKPPPPKLGGTDSGRIHELPI